MKTTQPSAKSEARYANQEDIKWLIPIFEQTTQYVGNVLYGWSKFWEGYRWIEKSIGECWIVIPEEGYAHFAIMEQPINRIVLALGVSQSHRRQGVGTRLLDSIGYPMSLFTEVSNVEANSFYQALGFTLFKSQDEVNCYRKGDSNGSVCQAESVLGRVFSNTRGGIA